MTAGAPEVPEGTTAADRVRAFLDARREVPATDLETIHRIFGTAQQSLLVRDLRILINLVDTLSIMAPTVPTLVEAWHYSEEYTP